MNLQETFTAEVEGFLALHSMEPTKFGRQALNDPNFVSDLRTGGRCPNLRTIEKVRGFMAEIENGGADSTPAPAETEQ